jgi:hypothetical protein
LLGNEPRLAERIDVHSLNAIGLRLYKSHVGQATIASRDVARELLQEAASAVEGHKFALHFLVAEWEQVVDAWQLDGWEAYRDVARLGRKTRIPEPKRKVLWSIFERVRAGLKARKLLTYAEVFSALAAAISKTKKPVFDFGVVDEAQDITIAHVGFFAALGGGRRNALFFAGDLGQRIFQQPFSWKALGADIRGRSRTLRVNYRHPTKSALRRTAFSVQWSLMWMETARIGATRFPCSMAPRPWFGHLKARARKSLLSATGLRSAPKQAFCRTNSGSLSGRRRNWIVGARP